MPAMSQEQSQEIARAGEVGSVLDDIPKATIEIKMGLMMFSSCM